MDGVCVRITRMDSQAIRSLFLVGILCSAANTFAARPNGPPDSAPAPPPSTSEAPDTLRLVNWNVENLFDTKANQPADPETGKSPDAEFTPESWRHWTESRYNTKLERLAWVIDRMRPDVLALQEIENRAVVDDLVRVLGERHGWTFPHIVHRESGDHRGIDLAILSRFPVVAEAWFPKNGPRGLLGADIDIGGARLVIYTLHWKSQLGDKATNNAIRRNEAAALRTSILGRLAHDPDAAVVALGDFNENWGGPAQTGPLGAATNRADALASAAGPADGSQFYNLVGDIPEEQRGTFYWNQSHSWNTLDGIVVSPRMLLPPDRPGPDWRAVPGSTFGFATPEMRWNDGRPNAYRRSRRYASGSGGDKVEGETSYTGYSDHFPLVTVLKRADGVL